MNQATIENLEPPLGDRLVQTALELLAEEGIEALTLRSVARRAGVSHGAPARHFRSLSDLRAEVAATGFRLLSEAIENSDAASLPSRGPMLRLAAAGRAYAECALANPGLFALMFRKGDLDPDNESLMRDSSAAFERLLDVVGQAQAEGWQAGRDSRLLAGALWASVHGLATLWAGGAYQGAIPHASLDDALKITLELTDDVRQGESI
jgi:AcrR family transcriptional regulator